MVTPRAVFKRTITTEVRSGLTCIGDAVSTVDSGSSGTTDTATSTGDGSVSGASATSKCYFLTGNWRLERF
jgi:hypothetical protein